MKWISIDKQKPDSGEYIVSTPSRGEEAADYWAEEDKWQTLRVYGYASDPEDLHDVTHWMPYPPPPKRKL